MPAMTAREFVDTVAVPNVLEFMADPTQRRGYNACLTAYHVGDYLKLPGERWAADVHKEMEKELGAPFLALQRMADAVKHREKVQGKRGAETLLMQSGSDTVRPPTGFGMTSADNPLRLGDGGGGRWIEDAGRRYDMLDLCVIILRAYQRLHPVEFADSLINDIKYSTAEYAR